MFSDDDLLPLSGLQHMAYCERQWALIHVERLWEESSDTLRGRFFHERVDTAGYSCREGIRAARSVRITSYRLGLFGVADIVEYCMKSGSAIMPVEYKVGKPKVEDWDRLQVCAQVLCLEEMEGVRIDAGALFYGETRKREVVEITEGLRNRVTNLAQRMHTLFENGLTPRGESGKKCGRCSLRDECLPIIGNLGVIDYWKGFGLEDGG